MKHFILTIALLLAIPAHASDMTAIPEAKNLITEIWCVAGFKFLYVEKTTNETFQFFQITQNGGMAVKVIPCDGTETRTIK